MEQEKGSDAIIMITLSLFVVYLLIFRVSCSSVCVNIYCLRILTNQLMTSTEYQKAKQDCLGIGDTPPPKLGIQLDSCLHWD